MLLSLLLPACSPSPLAAKRLLKKPRPKLRPLTQSLKTAPLPLLKALTPLLLVPTLLLLVRTLLRPPLLRLLTPLLLRPLPLLRLLLRLKKRSKSQPFGAMTETKRGGLPLRKSAFFVAD